MNPTTKIGYRVSTLDQLLDLQTQALTQAGCYQTYTNHGVTGRTMARAQLEACIKALRTGDTLVIWKIDRLSRNVKGLSELLETLDNKGVFFSSHRRNRHLCPR